MPDSYDTPIEYWQPDMIAAQVGDSVRAMVLGWDSNVFEVGVEIPEDPVIEGTFDLHRLGRRVWDFLVNGESVDPATIERI